MDSRNQLPILHGSPNSAVRNIASGVMGPGTGGMGQTSGANPQINTRTSHYNESGINLYSVGVCYSGWFQFASSANANCTNAYTVTASIEYPAGTFTQVTWQAGGSTSAVISPGSNVASDLIGVFIPKGAQFWVRTYGVGAGGGLLPISSILNSNNGELGEQAASGLADKTLGGTITGATSTLRPSAIISRVPSTMQSWAGLGDSYMAGQGEQSAGTANSGFDSHGNTGPFGRAFTGRLPFLNISCPGQRVDQVTPASAYAGALGLLKLAGITHSLSDFGVNDVTNGDTQALIQNNLQLFWNMLAGIGLIHTHTTINMETTSTNFWTDLVNQTPRATGGGFSGGASSVRALVDVFIRTKPAPVHQILDMCALCESSLNSGLWGVGNGFNSVMQPSDICIASGTPSTTVVQSNSTRPTGYFQGAGTAPYTGFITFTSGLNAGISRAVTAYSSTNGQFTITPALTVAYVVGDTFNAFPLGFVPTIDGIHPLRSICTPILAGNTPPAYMIGGAAQAIQNAVTAMLNATNSSLVVGGFNPSQISGCELWLQADDFTTIYEGTATRVLEWLDKSGNGNNAFAYLASGTSSVPINGTGFPGTSNAMIFNGGSHAFNLPAALYGIAGAANTVFVVLSSAGSGDATQNIITGYNGTPAARWGINRTSTTIGVLNDTSDATYTTQASTLSTTPIIVAMNYNGSATVQPSINGVKGTPGSGGGVVANFTSMTISGNPGQTATRFNGSISDIIIFNSSLTSAQMNAVGNYLSALRGISWTNQ